MNIYLPPLRTARALGPGLILVFTALLWSSERAAATSHETFCDSGTQVVTELVRITEPCTVTGNLIISSATAGLNVDYVASPENIFFVQGNIFLLDGYMSLQGGTLSIQQDNNRHRTIGLLGDSVFTLKDAVVITNQDVGSKYMMLIAMANSTVNVVNSYLEHTTSSLIGNFFGNSRLLVLDSQWIPSEVYVKGASTVHIAGTGPTLTGNTGAWFVFDNGATGVIDLPAQSDENGLLAPYTWSIGRNSPELTGVRWQFSVSNSIVGLGVESYDNTEVTINGLGVPENGELSISYHVEGGTETMNDLSAGLQNRSLDDGRLVLNNVNLGPIAWQIYAHDNEMLTVVDSVINEIGAIVRGNITIRNSTLQWASVAALGNDSTLTIEDSQVHSQTIEAFRNGVVTVRDSAIYGGVAQTHEPTSEIHFEGGAFLSNAEGECDINNALDEFGIPSCNPFLTPGAQVIRTGVGSATCTGTEFCDW